MNPQAIYAEAERLNARFADALQDPDWTPQDIDILTCALIDIEELAFLLEQGHAEKLLFARAIEEET